MTQLLKSTRGKCLQPIQLTLVVLLSFVPLSTQAVSGTGDTLMRIKARKELKCGVSEGILGFSQKDDRGRWSGLDVDFCRAVAAVVLEDPEKVDFVPLSATRRMTSLKMGEIDLLARNTTWTMEREAVLGILFTGVLYYGGQGFVVNADSAIKELSDLNGAKICMTKGSTHEKNLDDIFSNNKMTFQPIFVESQSQTVEALINGHCQAFTSEDPQLAAVSMLALEKALKLRDLDLTLSKDPLGPVVLAGDQDWFTLVRWVLFTLIAAEEEGYTKDNVHAKLHREGWAQKNRLIEMDGLISNSLKIAPGWMERAVSAGGNYGELYERNLGSNSLLKIDRGFNRLWNQGGLMFAPPVF